MENIDNKLDNLIGMLRQQNPELNKAELLTDSIMNQVGNKSHRSKLPVLIWVRTISSSAAVLLIGLFLYQQTEAESIASNYQPKHCIKNNINIDSICMQNLNENRTNLVETYRCHLQQNSIKNNQYKAYTQQLIN
jgi:hypothetical protein